MYKILLIAPYPPIKGGMAILSKTLAKNFEDDSNIVFRLQLYSGLKGVILLPLIYLKMLVFSLKADIIHVISASGRSLIFKDLPAILIAKLFNKKSILHFNGGAAIDRSKHWRWYRKLPFKIASVVVLPTTKFKIKLINNGLNGNYKIIPHPISNDIVFNDTNQFRSSNPIMIASKGMEYYAGHLELLDVFRKVQNEIPQSRLWFTSDGIMKQKIIEKIKKLKLENVVLHGSVSQKDHFSLMNDADIFIHGTKYESFGLVLVEAMALGLPVVSFNVGGISDIVENEKNGYLVDYLDINQFARKIIELASHPEKYKLMRTKCIDRAKKFKWDNINYRWYEIYGE